MLTMGINWSHERETTVSSKTPSWHSGEWFFHQLWEDTPDLPSSWMLTLHAGEDSNIKSKRARGLIIEKNQVT